jgi:hypothetical protein
MPIHKSGFLIHDWLLAFYTLGQGFIRIAGKARIFPLYLGSISAIGGIL